MKRHILLAGICLPSIAGPLWTASAVAQAVQAPQEAAQSSGLSGSGEIIVTARKREETSLSVPVVLTAVSAAEIDRRGIIKLDDLAKVVPQLQLGIGGSNFFGGVMAIRGITGSEGNPFGDQSVSFNVDGVQVSKALIRRLAEMDLAQVEVLKGPQALFFGKNSPGGVVSLRSADPTPNFEAKARAWTHYAAHQMRVQMSLTAAMKLAGSLS